MADETRDELGVWARRCGDYEMRAAQGDAGKLVRLDRVRRWLMAGDDGLPAQAAGAAIVKPLEAASDLSEWLYLTNDNGYARLVNASDRFLYLPIFFLDREDSPPEPEHCGTRGACRWMGTFWREMDATLGIHVVEPLAVPVAKAAVLWGWGEPAAAKVSTVAQPADWLAVCTFRKANPRAPWDTNQVAIGKAEFKRRGGEVGGKKTAVLDAMAKELGVSRQVLDRALFYERKRNAKPRAPWFPTSDSAEQKTG